MKRRKRGLEHWKMVAIIMAFYDVLMVSFAYFAALWLRFDGKFSMIRTRYLDAWKHFIPIYIAAGIGEEFLFRVALVEPLGLVLSSLLFTAIHIAYWSKPLILLYVFVFGMICGALYLYTGSFLLCATAHAVYNFTLSCLMKFGIIKLED